MSDELSDKYTEDTRAFHKGNTRSPGLEEFESGSKFDVHNDDSDRSEGVKRPAEDPNTKVSLVMVNTYADLPIA